MLKRNVMLKRKKKLGQLAIKGWEKVIRREIRVGGIGLLWVLIWVRRKVWREGQRVMRLEIGD